jgi:import inner membrane translocase subunit TIM54
LNEPPAIVPPLPPLLLVSFTNYVGFKLIPLMISDFFNQRHKVRVGAEAAYRLVQQNTRPFEAPTAASDALTPIGRTATDLDFDRDAESYYKKSLSSIPDDIEKARKKYYEALGPKLVTARAIARNTRELTKDEWEHPPPTEVELRAERMKKEKRWRGDLEGWEILKPQREVAWDDRFADALRIFIDPREDV